MSPTFTVDTAIEVPGIKLCESGSPVNTSPIVKGALLAVSPEVTVPTTTLPTVTIQYEPGPVVPVPTKRALMASFERPC